MAITKNDLIGVFKKYNNDIKSKLSLKVDKTSGKDLSTNDYTTTEKNKLAGIATGATKTVLNNTVTSTSTTEAATANAVKTAYDKGNHSHPYAATSHTHNYAGSSSAGGVANSAVKLQTARMIALSGQVKGSTTFDGSGNVIITTSEGLETINSGSYSHAEGFEAQSYGDYSHAEGSYTLAKGESSHAEGGLTVSSAIYSHAEGLNSKSIGESSHAEGGYTEASGNYSHAEGYNSKCYGDSTHVEGLGNLAISGDFVESIQGNTDIEITVNKVSDNGVELLCNDIEWQWRDNIIESSYFGTDCSVIFVYLINGNYNVIEFTLNSYIPPGSNSDILTFNLKTLNSNMTSIIKGSLVHIIWNTQNNTCSHAEGCNTIAFKGSHAEGYNTIANGEHSHAEGYKTIASSQCSHAEGYTSTSSSTGSHAEGYNTSALNIGCHAEGGHTTASGSYSSASGSYTIASGTFSQTEGYRTTAETYGLHTMGQYNKANSGNSYLYSSSNNAFVIGNGSASTKSNAFRINYSGVVYGLSSFNSTGADYAEYFEWEDGNVNNEDRIGRFVTLSGKKIKLASENDYILGVISGNPAVIGNTSDDSWNDMYLRDKYGRLIYEDVKVEAEYEIIPAVTEIQTNENDEDAEVEIVKEKTICIKEAGIEKHIKLNPNYNPELEYIPRSERKEWDAIGMLGQLIVIDDGSCIVDGYCKCNEIGIATKSESGYRVIERIDEETILILFK